jgi:hypothetical protein
VCHFITAILPCNARRQQAATIFEAHKPGFREISNPHLLSFLEAGDKYILTTRKHCDCGTVPGSLNQPDDSGAVNFEREIGKFRKQGWSEAKIKRWLNQKAEMKEKAEREVKQKAEASLTEADYWIRFITDLLGSGCTDRIGLLLHWYSGGIESERIKITGKEKMKLANLTPMLVMTVKEDVIYEFVG